MRLQWEPDAFVHLAYLPAVNYEGTKKTTK